ncbi:MAG TPA: copper homeostasis protein CutC [Feifaniaceae bacterium]|nr:copper homeostasis protein CutC [Feifaniaceae bacterium]
MRTLVEICCGSADDVFEAAAAGADRAELSAALPLGGLTPSIGQLAAAKTAGLELIAMVRPREGGFCYGAREFDVMLRDAHALLAAGADGVAFGILNGDGTVDAGRCERLLRATGPKQAVFHRAVDVTPDWRAAIDTLCALGFRRVLTSGQAPTAIEGAATIREMIAYANGRIEILPGAGIRPDNVPELVKTTGCTQVHASLRGTRIDASCSVRPDIRFGGALPPSEDTFAVTDPYKVRDFLAALSGQ